MLIQPSVPQGGAAPPGSPVTAVLAPDGIITVVMTDPAGGVHAASSNPYYASGDPVQGWGPWYSLPLGAVTTPGAPVTAVQTLDGTYTLFMADRIGTVYFASSTAQGWGDWGPVLLQTGTTTPGAPVTAVLAPDGIITLFLADPGGVVWTTSGNPAQGQEGVWNSVSPWTEVSPQTGTTTPGAPLSAVLAPDGTYTVFLADPGGVVRTASGSPAGGWGEWAPVSQKTGTTTPGAPVTAVLAPDGIVTLFMFSAVPGVGVCTVSGSPAQGLGGWEGSWTSVSHGSTTPGAPITAVLAPDGTYTLFLADPGGTVRTASGNPAQGWGGGWTPVSPQTGITTPGAHVTAALAPDGIITLFMFSAVPSVGVCTASGSPAGDWEPWSSVSQGSTTPGAPITAVLTPDGPYTLFLADPGGGVYTAGGSPAGGWGGWAPVSPQAGSTTPGVPVTAVLAPDEFTITLFLADPGGRVYTASGSLYTESGRPAPVWGPWSSVSQGSTIPGAPITAVVAPDGTYTLFLADPGGGVYTASGSPAGGWGPWSSVSQGSTIPGAPITAVLAPDGIITLFAADRGGGVYTASGSPAGGWGPWSSVSQGSTIPGAPITAVLAPDGTYTLFMADRTGEVRTTSRNAQGWAEWSGVSPGLTTTPGAPITAVVAPDDGIITLFLAVPGTGVGTASGNPAQGWGKWSLVSQGSTIPGARITAVLVLEGTYTLFMASPGGIVVTASQSPAGGWGDWAPVSQGVSQASTTPGATVTAVLAPDRIITLFLPIPGHVTLSWP